LIRLDWQAIEPRMARITERMQREVISR
jgi:hypothetical protein